MTSSIPGPSSRTSVPSSHSQRNPPLTDTTTRSSLTRKRNAGNASVECSPGRRPIVQLEKMSEEDVKSKVGGKVDTSRVIVIPTVESMDTSPVKEKEASLKKNGSGPAKCRKMTPGVSLGHNNTQVSTHSVTPNGAGPVVPDEEGLDAEYILPSYDMDHCLTLVMETVKNEPIDVVFESVLAVEESSAHKSETKEITISPDTEFPSVNQPVSTGTPLQPVPTVDAPILEAESSESLIGLIITQIAPESIPHLQTLSNIGHPHLHEDSLLIRSPSGNLKTNSRKNAKTKKSVSGAKKKRTVTETTCVIDELLKTPFSGMTSAKKKELVNAGRPCPALPDLTMMHKDKAGSFTRRFNTARYESILWLAGSAKLSRLFCWPCLLFSDESSIWRTAGFINLNNLSNAVCKHQQSQSHLRAFVQLKQFGEARIHLQLDEQIRLNVANHNEVVRKNRETLRRMIDTVGFLANQGLAFGGHDNDPAGLNKGNYVELLNYLRVYDPVIHAHLQTENAMGDASNQIQNSLIQSISDALSTAIKEEISKASYVAILLDETSDIVNLSQLSTTLRYVHNSTGKVHERFISFTDVSADRSANGLLNHVKKIVEEYNLKDKLIAQSFNGAVVRADHIRELRTKIQELYPNSLFVHCFSHLLNLVLAQSVSTIRECCVFFQTLTGLASFFSKSPKRIHEFREFIKKRMPGNVLRLLNVSSQLVHTANQYRSAFLGFFQSILHEDSQNWDIEAIVASQGFIHFFSDFQTSFLLTVFSRIFAYTDVLSNILQNRSLDIIYCAQKIQEVRTVLKLERDKFDEVWSDAENGTENSFEVVIPNIPPNQQEGHKVSFKTLFIEIIDNVTTQLEERFVSLSQLEFTALLNHLNYESYQRKISLTEAVFEKLKKTYKSTFDFVTLRNELVVLYDSAGFDKPLQELIQFMREEGYQSGFTEVYKLGTLILTLPSTMASEEHSSSALKRIISFQGATQGQERVPGLDLISIEKGLLQQLRQRSTFYEDVIQNFMARDRHLELAFK